MPKRSVSDGKWYCSWDCGFSDEDLEKVSHHEEVEHNASWLEEDMSKPPIQGCISRETKNEETK